MDRPTIDLTPGDRIKILKDSDGWFGRAPAELQDAVLSRCEWRNARAGVPIFRAVDECVDLFGVVQGSVEIYGGFGTGDNPLLHIGHEGTWYGMASLISPGRGACHHGAPGGSPARAPVDADDARVARRPARVVASLRRRRPRIRRSHHLRLHRSA